MKLCFVICRCDPEKEENRFHHRLTATHKYNLPPSQLSTHTDPSIEGIKMVLLDGGRSYICANSQTHTHTHDPALSLISLQKLCEADMRSHCRFED